MIDEASRPNYPFQERLVWKFSRFTRKREHTVAFKSMLRRRGVRVVSSGYFIPTDDECILKRLDDEG